MKKYILSLGLLITAFFIFVPSLHAIDNTEEGLSFVCLAAEHCTKDSSCSVEDVHRARLTPDLANSRRSVENSKKSYIAECIDLDKDGDGLTEIVCTTGSSALDMEVFDHDFFTELQNATHGPERKPILYNLDGSRGEFVDNSDHPYGVYYMRDNEIPDRPTAPPITVETDSRGYVIPNVIEWQSYTDVKLTRRFLLYTIVKSPTSTNRGLGGQQLDDLGKAYVRSSCEGQAWDPYGRVFDAKSLQPIPGVRVELKMLDQKATPPAYSYTEAERMNPHVDNPDSTERNGGFEFIVVDGTYSLTPSKDGYTFPKSDVLATLSPNTQRIYSNLYYADSPGIVQAGAIQQRDIPMMPNGEGKTYEILVEPNQTVTQNGQQIFSGKVSHPYALLKVSVCPTEASADAVCGTPKVYTVAEGAPGKDGEYRILLDQTKLSAGQKYTVVIEANPNLATATLTWTDRIQKTIGYVMSFIVPAVNAQSKSKPVSFDVEPIPTYIEGYAYDAKGVLLPNAIVGVYVPFSRRPVYQIVANEQGYFKITSENLPSGKYTIEYRTTASEEPQTKLTTSQFLAQNKEFIESEKVNTYLYATQNTDPRRNVTPSYVPKQTTNIVPKVSLTPAQASPSAATENVEQEPTQNPLFLIGAILLLLVATAGTLLAVYLYRKRMQQPNDMNS